MSAIRRRILRYARPIVAAAVLFLVVPASRGPLLVLLALLILGDEVRRRLQRIERPIRLRVNGTPVHVPATGGSVSISGRDVPVSRVGETVLLDGRPLAVGEFRIFGSSEVERLS